MVLHFGLTISSALVVDLVQKLEPKLGQSGILVDDEEKLILDINAGFDGSGEGEIIVRLRVR